MKMGGYWVSQEAVHLARQRSIHGGVGFSGIVVTVCAYAMNKDHDRIGISI